MDSLEGIGKETLGSLSKDDLVGLCKQRSIPYSGRNKDDLVASLMKWKANLSRENSRGVDSLHGKGTSYFEGLLKEDLVALCKERNIPCSGLNKDELVDELMRWKRRAAKSASDSARPSPIPLHKALGRFFSFSHCSDDEDSEEADSSSEEAVTLREPKAAPSKAAPKKSGQKGGLYEKMSKAAYRTAMGKADPSSVLDGTHVCHIIAVANNGADARENYVMMNGALNMKLGSKGDHVMAYVVGIHKTLLAVAASKHLNGYDGPEAETLYRKGEAFFRDRFGAQLRNEHTSDRMQEAAKLI